MKVKVPPGVVALTELQGLGPKRVKTLYDTLEIHNLEDLEVAAKAGRLRGLPGFGEKVEQNVLQALASAQELVGPHAARGCLAGRGRHWSSTSVACRASATPKRRAPSGGARRPWAISICW
jgi:hypothetical protein